MTKFTAKHSRGRHGRRLAASRRTAGLPLILRNESVCLRGLNMLENPAAGMCMALEVQPYHTLQAARSCPVIVISLKFNSQANDCENPTGAGCLTSTTPTSLPDLSHARCGRPVTGGRRRAVRRLLWSVATVRDAGFLQVQSALCVGCLRQCCACQPSRHLAGGKGCRSAVLTSDFNSGKE